MGFPSVAVNLLMHRTQTHPHPSPPLEGEGAKQDKEVLRLRDISFVDVATLLARYDLHLERVADDAPIPGSYWGDCEAGLIGATVHARSEEHTSDLQSLMRISYAVFCLKKKNNTQQSKTIT